jgi:hypothetical protein
VRTENDAPVVSGGPTGEFKQDDKHYTQQTCYVQADESELCVYDNVICYDGNSPVVLVDHPIMDPPVPDDYVSGCFDYRFYEASAMDYDGCIYMMNGARKLFRHRVALDALPPGRKTQGAFEVDTTPPSPKSPRRVQGLPLGSEAPVASVWTMHPLHGAETLREREPNVEHSLSLRRRRWGPHGRGGGLSFREVRPESVLGPDYAAPDALLNDTNHWTQRWGALAAESGGYADGEHDPALMLPPKGGAERGILYPGLHGGSAPKLPALDSLPKAKIIREGGFDHEVVPGLRVDKRVDIGYNRTVDWVDGTLWLVGLDSGSATNPFHWMSKMGLLFDAQRSNATRGFGAHPMDRYVLWANKLAIKSEATASRDRRSHVRTAWKQGSQWAIPSMDNVVLVGSGSTTIKHIAHLGDWFEQSSRIVSQPHTKFFANELVRHLSPKRLICARRGVVVGAKYRLFTSRADHWLFRMYAYQVAGVLGKGLLPHPRYPPRKITVLDRSASQGRNIYNLHEVLEILGQTGLEVEYVPSVSKMTFAAQVELMAGTGILVGPHGAALANAMFMPAHAVIVELFPPWMKKLSYATLANTAGLIHIPVYGRPDELPVEGTKNVSSYGYKLMNDRKFMTACLRAEIGGYETNIHHACNGAMKYLPVVVPMARFREVVRDAVDAISANYAGRADFTSKSAKEKQPPRGPPSALVEENLAILERILRPRADEKDNAPKDNRSAPKKGAAPGAKKMPGGADRN